MTAVSGDPCLTHDSSHPSRPVWTADVFRNSDDARVELSIHRAGFLQRRDIMALIPSHIRRRIRHPEGVARVEGFQDLLILLNLDPDAEQLRRLIIDYFKSSPTLRVQLGSYMSPPSSSSRDAQASSVGLVAPSIYYYQSSSSPSDTSDQYGLGSFFLVRSTGQT